MKKPLLSFLVFCMGCASNAPNSAVDLYGQISNLEESVVFQEHGCRGFSVSEGNALFEHKVFENRAENILTLDDGLQGHKVVMYDIDGDMDVDKLSNSVYLFRPIEELPKSQQIRAEKLFSKYVRLLNVGEFFRLWKSKYSDAMNFY